MRKQAAKEKKTVLTHKETDEFFSYLGKARAMAWKLANNEKKAAFVRRSFRSIHNKLEGIANDYYWGDLTDDYRL